MLALPLILLAVGSCTEPNPYLGICGNGAIEPAFEEECDDGEGNGDAAACTDACQLAICGDGLVHSGVEECDLGSLNSDAGDCTLSCAIKECGDGIVQPGEECDDGGLNRWPPNGEGGCSIYCLDLPECGNGQVEEGEACDDGNTDDEDECLSSCISATCGDGVVLEGIEECDDGNSADDDLCPTTSLIAKCGDGLVHEGVEECDDENDDNNDACLSACLKAVCGDGLVYEGVEECDDGNLDPDDGCNAECIADRQVFVTTESIAAGELMGIDGANAICQEEAETFGLAQPERFIAWLSDSKSSPASRFETREARYVLVDGSVIADSWDDLIDGQLSHPIDQDADGEVVDKLVWTSTLATGDAIDTGEFCGDWTLSDETFARRGATSVTDSEWTNLALPGFCFQPSYLYCFQD